MSTTINLDIVCSPADAVVFREIEGEIIIIPLVSGIGDTDDELYSLNDCGRAIWQKLDGLRTLEQVAVALESEYDAPADDLRSDVAGFVAELVGRGLLSVKA